MASMNIPQEAHRPAALWLWAGQAIYRGPSLRLDAHSTAVDCLAIGVDAPFGLEADGIARTVRSALIPPRTVHRVVTDGDRMMFCYLDPGSPRARACREQMTLWDRGFGFSHRGETRLAEAAGQDRPDPRALADLVGAAPRPPMDDRVREAMATLLAHPARQITADRFAAAAHLSESRFLHLFSSQAGTSFRRYRLWARMLGAGRAIAKEQASPARPSTPGSPVPPISVTPSAPCSDCRRPHCSRPGSGSSCWTRRARSSLDHGREGPARLPN